MKPDCIIELPKDYRRNEFLDFHSRDALMVSERVDADLLIKGITWDNYPARLTIRFVADHAEVELVLDGSPSAPNPYASERLARRMLGLTQQIDVFEQQYMTHPQLGRLIAKRHGLRVPLAATPYEALTWAITGQQISVKAAVSVRRNFIEIAGVQHSSGLWCYPDANRISHLTETDLRQAGFSLSKAQTILALSQSIRQNQLIFQETLDAESAAEVCADLLKIRGIGPWTVNYALLRGFGWLDGSLHGDVAVRRGIQSLIGASEKITEEKAQHWLASFSPWRALVAAHLWAMQSKN